MKVGVDWVLQQNEDPQSALYGLMGDMAQRAMFYGADCALCRNSSVWKVQRKMMDP